MNTIYLELMNIITGEVFTVKKKIDSELVDFLWDFNNGGSPVPLKVVRTDFIEIYEGGENE